MSTPLVSMRQGNAPRVSTPKGATPQGTASPMAHRPTSRTSWSRPPARGGAMDAAGDSRGGRTLSQPTLRRGGTAHPHTRFDYMHARQRRNQRRWMLVVAAALVLVIAVVLVPRALSAASSSSDTATSSADEVETVVEEVITVVPMSEAEDATYTTDSGIEVVAPEAFASTDELAAVEEALAALQEDGSTVGFVLWDMDSDRSLRYNDDSRFYSASSIKIAVCTMIFEENGGGAGYSDTIYNALVNSSNDDFSRLTHIFGYANVSEWLIANGAPEAGADAASSQYVYISASELANVWQEVWRYGTSGEDGSEELGSYLAQTNHSPIGTTLRDVYEVWSKPGWYPNDSYNIPASNDAGIVFSDTGDYVLVVLTDIGDNTDALIPLIEALDAAHSSMCGDELVEVEVEVEAD